MNRKLPAKDGDSLVLTIDEVVQHYVEKYLQEGLVNNNVKNRGCAIVMNVKTGAILGMAVKGDFDPNNPFVVADPIQSRGNRQDHRPARRRARRSSRRFRSNGATNVSATPISPVRFSR